MMMMMMRLLGTLLTMTTTTTLVHGFTVSSNAPRVFVSTPVSKYHKKLVSDCMVTRPLVLYPDESVDEAMSKLLQHPLGGLTGAPVVDTETFRLVGMVTQFDFLDQEAFQGALLPMEGSLAQVQSYVQAARKICGRKIEDVMTTDPLYTIQANQPMREAAALMTQHRINWLPVVNEDQLLVGLVSASDVMRDLLHIVKNLPPAPSSVSPAEIEGSTSSTDRPPKVEEAEEQNPAARI